MKNKVIGIVVARNTSSRFPRKHLEKIGNKTFLEILFDRFKKVENVDKIICTVPPIIASNLTFHQPKSVKEAQFSLEFPVALMVKYGDIKLEHLSSDYILDPVIKNLINKVTMNVAELPKRFKPSR